MKVLAVARLTIAEAAKRRLLVTGVVVSVAFVALFVATFAFLDVRTDEPGAVVSTFAATFLTVFGLYTVYFLTGLLAVFLAAGAVSGDVDSGVLDALLARPLSRAQYLLGRWLALAGLVTVYVTTMVVALLAVAWAYAGYVALQPVATVALLSLQAVVLLSLALLGSTVLPTVANGAAVLALFALSWLAGIVGGIGRTVGNDAMALLATVVGVAVPSDPVWRAASYFAQSPVLVAAGDVPGIPFAASTPPPAGLVAWGVAYPLLVLGLAAVAFSRRDL